MAPPATSTRSVTVTCCVTESLMQALLDHQANKFFGDVMRAPAYRGMRKLTLFGDQWVMITAPAPWTTLHAQRSHMPKPLFAGYHMFLLLVRPFRHATTHSDPVWCYSGACTVPCFMELHRFSCTFATFNCLNSRAQA